MARVECGQFVGGHGGGDGGGANPCCSALNRGDANCMYELIYELGSG